MAHASNSSRNEEILCPLCGRELRDSERAEGGWMCRCEEFVPEGTALRAFEGCTHGLGCNCARERRRQ